MLDPSLIDLARRCISEATTAGLKLATAESCTGGLIAAYLTHIPGSSDAFERGFVTYSDAAKTELLSVPVSLIERCGAVSREVAEAMARGALSQAHAEIAVSVTGIAGPSGGSAAKPVGLVFIASARRGGATHCTECRFGDIGRETVREKSAARALEMMLEEIAAARRLDKERL